MSMHMDDGVMMTSATHISPTYCNQLSLISSFCKDISAVGFITSFPLLSSIPYTRGCLQDWNQYEIEHLRLKWFSILPYIVESLD